MRYHAVLAVLLGACAIAFSTSPYAQGSPARPITIIVPAAPGGTTDIVARIMSVKLGEALGQPIVVDNKAGAAGIIGVQAAAKATPDGQTLLMSANQAAMVAALHKSPPYDLVRSFIPITSIGLIPTVLVVNPQIPANNVSELIALAKRDPDRLSFATAGNGSPNHFFAALLNTKAGVKMLHVPYKGIVAAVTDVAEGRVSMSYASLPAVRSLIDSGKLKALAVTSPQRTPSLPGVPAIAESVPGYAADIWIGLWGVANTPDAVIARIYAATIKTLTDADVRKRLTDIGLVIEPRTMAQFRSMIQPELETWSKVVQDSQGSIERQ